MKHFIDHEINSIQNFMSDDMKALYDMVDVNVYQENIFHTKMLLKEFDLKHYMFHTKPEDLTGQRAPGNYRCAVERNARDLLRAQYASCLTALAELPGSADLFTSAARNCGKPPPPAENPQRRIATGFLRRSSSSPLPFHRQRIPVNWREPSPLRRPSIAYTHALPAARNVRYLSVRALLVPLHQARPWFSFTSSKPVPDHFMPHGHTHLYHSGNIAQKFVIHSVFLCSRQCAEIALRH